MLHVVLNGGNVITALNPFDENKFVKMKNFVENNKFIQLDVVIEEFVDEGDNKYNTHPIMLNTKNILYYYFE